MFPPERRHALGSSSDEDGPPSLMFGDTSGLQVFSAPSKQSTPLVGRSNPVSPQREKEFCPQIVLKDLRLEVANPFSRRHYLGQNDLRPEATMITASDRIGVTPAGVYAWRPPSPPHIHIPQAADDHLVKLSNLPETGYGYSEEDQRILQSITQHPDAKLGVRDWRYEQRRGAQSILSFVYLGPSAGARDIEYLRKEGITMLLVIRDRMSAMARLLSGDKTAAVLGIESQAIDVTGNQELIRMFPKVSRVINEHLIRIHKQRLAKGIQVQDNPGKVLVFCESGNERSAVVMTAYLMETYGLDMIDAVQYVQSQRFCVAFDDGLKNLLFAYQDILNAQKHVRTNSTMSSQRVVSASKRRRNDADEDNEDVDMDRADDEERFGHRSNFAPFHEAN